MVAIQELVKNAYDADSHRIRLTFEGPLEKGLGGLTIEDDGDGMTLETVRTAWMEPATIAKRRQTRTRAGRRVTGEKGIGRFASARIASQLELDSVARENGRRVMAHFNWGEFEGEDRYLDEIRCRWEEGAAPRGRGHGTILRLRQFTQKWNEENLRNLRVQLSRLLPPTGPKADFEIGFAVGGTLGKRLSGPIERPTFIEHARYQLRGRVEADGSVTAEVSYRSRSEPFVEKGGAPVRVVIEREGEEDRPPTCGPFEFDIRVWDREPEDMRELAKAAGSTLRDVRMDLDELSGLQVYRDRFRIVMQTRDWLGLDLRRVQNPSLRLSNNQIVGHVQIESDRNTGLVDQSNRQALVDSPQLDDFEEAILFLLNRLEVFRRLKRRSPERPPPRASLLEKFNLTELQDYVAKSDHSKDEKLTSIIQSTAAGIKTGLGQVREIVSRYRRLATLGTLVDVILHEGRTPIAAISNSVEILKKSLAGGLPAREAAEVKHQLDVVDHQVQVLTQLFDRVAPFSGRARGRVEVAPLEDIIARAFAVHAGRIEKEGVRVELPSGQTTIRMDPIDLELLFLNLIDNALYWLQKVPAGKRAIRVEVARTDGRVEVVFSDSGPGVQPEIADMIWDPWFTTKPGGIGLGLTIAGETAAEHDATLGLSEKGPLPGATFVVTFNSPGGEATREGVE
ncbi:MAG: ATP-binding protein [Thermoplasmata archaeon]